MPRMTDNNLRPATPAELRQALSYGLRFDTSGKSYRAAGDYMADIAADILVRHLEQAGFVVMKKPGRGMPKAG